MGPVLRPHRSFFWGFGGLGFRGLGFRGLGFRGLGFRGVWRFRGVGEDLVWDPEP